MTPEERIGQAIKAAREVRRWSRPDLARAAYISESSVYSLELGRKPIYVTGDRIRGYLKITIWGIEDAFGWRRGTVADIARGLPAPSEQYRREKTPIQPDAPQQSFDRVPEVITIEWIAQMILRYKTQ